MTIRLKQYQVSESNKIVIRKATKNDIPYVFSLVEELAKYTDLRFACIYGGVGAKAQIEKGNQTATALAINDYIAGKRSKEQVQSMIAGLKLKSELISVGLISISISEVMKK